MSMDSFPESPDNKGDTSSNADQWKHYVAAIQKFQAGFIANKYRAPQKISQGGERTQSVWGRNSIHPREDSTVLDSQRRGNSGTGFTNGSTAPTASIERGATPLNDANPVHGRSEMADKQRTQKVPLMPGTRMEVDAVQERLEGKVFSEASYFPFR
jgi:hypothetical protein